MNNQSFIVILYKYNINKTSINIGILIKSRVSKMLSLILNLDKNIIFLFKLKKSYFLYRSND